MVKAVDINPESDRVGEFPHPRETMTLLGHDKALQVISDAFESRSMHHAWLLAGNRGIGKATLAYRAARYILRWPDGKAGGAPEDMARDMAVPENDPVVRQIAALSHPDLFVLRRQWDDTAKKLKTVITVDDVRRALQLFTYSTAANGWRICIVDAADDMNPNAANALLKTLEEPPQRSLFLIIAHQPDRLIATLRSRCRRLSLAPLQNHDVAAILAAHGPDIRPQDQDLILSLADGSPGRALMLAEKENISLYRELIALLETLPGLDMEQVHGLAERVRRGGSRERAHQAQSSWLLLTTLLGDWLARLVRQRATGESTPAFPEENTLTARLCGAADLDCWMEIWEKTVQSVARADALNMDRGQVLLSAFSDIESVVRGTYRKGPVSWQI
ncbi:MAG: DNA polymerase III subunit delta' [Parvularculales bacterium]